MDAGGWFFDPNEGLFQTHSPTDFLDNATFMVAEYPEFKETQWYRCELE
jgi:hypothetical protein